MPTARRRKRTRLEPLIKDSTTPVFLLSAERKVLVFNAGCERLTGFSGDEVTGRVCDYAGGDVEPGAMGLTASLCPPPEVLAGQRASVPVYLPTPAGRSLPRMLWFFPLCDDEGAVESVLGVVTAIDPPVSKPGSSRHEIHAELTAVRQRLRRRYGLGATVCGSDAMQRAAAQAAIAAGSALGVCLQGERGTGKEHFARLIHYQGPAGVRSFVPLDCSIATAMELRRAVKRLIAPEEDEAVAPALRPGTLHLKHVEKFPRDLQETIVEAFADEERRTQHNLRLVVSTTNDLSTLLSDEALREDFYYLVSTIVITLPRLIERMPELDLLAQHFLEEENRGREKQVGGFAPAVLERFHKYSWPGNLDELQTVVKECWTACRGEQVELDELPFRFQSAFAAQSEGPPVRPLLEPLDAFLERVEREQIEEALRQTRHNKTKAAEVLGIPRPKLYRRMEALGIEERE